MKVCNLTEAKRAATANAKFSGEPRYIVTDTSGNMRVEKTRPGSNSHNEQYWEALPDGTLRQVIARNLLIRLSIINSKHMPTVINDRGIRKQWVGIGWVDEGELDGDEVLVYDEDAKN